MANDVPMLAQTLAARKLCGLLKQIEDRTADVIITEDGTVEVWNTQAEEMFGWTRAEIIGKQLDEMVIPQRYRAAHRAGLERYKQHGVGKVLCRRLRIPGLHKDGHELMLEVWVTALVQSVELPTRFAAFLNLPFLRPEDLNAATA